MMMEDGAPGCAQPNHHGDDHDDGGDGGDDGKDGPVGVGDRFERGRRPAGAVVACS